MSPRWIVLALLVAGCAETGTGDDGELTGEIVSDGAWYHLDAANGLGPATLTVVNGYKVKCPNGTSAKTCHVTALVMPADCGWECQDNVLSLQGETVLRGHFDHDAFVVSTGLDTWQSGMGSSSLYRLSATTCASDPCPAQLSAQKINIASAPTTVGSVDFSHAADPNYVLDPTRGDDQALSDTGLIVSGKIISHVFRADRVWRLETSHPTCDPQALARTRGDNVVQFRTVAVAERAPAPVDESLYWVVRTGQTATTVSFTSGTNDLWAQEFTIAKSDCTLTVTGEH